MALRAQPRHHPREHRRANLCTAAAAPHRRVRERAQRLVARRRRHLGHGARVWRGVHLRKAARVRGHPRAVDPILEAPQPRRLEAERSFGGDRAAVARADDAQEAVLRREGQQRLAEQLASQIGGEGRPLPHGEDARLWPRVLEHGGNVAGGKHGGGADRLERLSHGDEAALVELQRRAGRKPGRGAALRAPDRLVARHLAARGAAEESAALAALAAPAALGLDGHHLLAEQRLDAPLGQDALKRRPHPLRVLRHQPARTRDEAHSQRGRVPPSRP
mmetsp:Transcript_23699/g.77423  ORF Transcript_23699/g.77423 Transcript_23699/m.77423 type:complete len:276 (-) Transcript_23699:948-1775(-)